MNRIEIYIGDFKRGNTAIRSRHYEHVSEGRECYWCYLFDNRVSLYISQTSEEGKKLKNFLDLDYRVLSEGDMELLLLSFCLPKLSARNIVDLMTDKYRKGFNAGIEKKIKEIKQILEIHDEN